MRPSYDDAADDPDRDALSYEEMKRRIAEIEGRPDFDAAMAGDPEYETLRLLQPGDVLLLALDPEGEVPEGWTRDGEIIWRVYDESVAPDSYTDVAAFLPIDGSLLKETMMNRHERLAQALGWTLVAFVGLVIPVCLLIWVSSL